MSYTILSNDSPFTFAGRGEALRFIIRNQRTNELRYADKDTRNAVVAEAKMMLRYAVKAFEKTPSAGNFERLESMMRVYQNAKYNVAVRTYQATE